MEKSLLLLALVLAVGGCASTAVRPGAPIAEGVTGAEGAEVVWLRGSNPERDAPRWTRSRAAALRAAEVARREVPKKYGVYVGVSEVKPTERAAMFSAMEDMLERYAVWLQGELDRILPEAAERAKVRLPEINTALGAYQAVGYLSRDQVERDAVVASWQATGTRCQVEACELLYLTYVLGRFDDKTREAHLLEAAIETFRHAIIRGEDKEEVLRQAERLIRRI
jgi:hypothetical protein